MSHDPLAEPEYRWRDYAEELAAAAKHLLALKDGPRDEDYRLRKEPAWERLRSALAHRPT